MSSTHKTITEPRTPLIRRAVLDALIKLNPRHQARNPVMFVVFVGSVLCTVLTVLALSGHGEAPLWFINMPGRAV